MYASGDDVLVIGDLHYKPKTVHTMDRFNKEVLGHVKENKISLVVCLGDTLDTFERINMACLNQAVRFFVKLSKYSEVVVLIGNHDRMNNNDYMTDRHPFIGLQSAGIKVIEKSWWDKKRNLIYVPYVPPGMFKKALCNTGWIEGKPPQPKIIFGHQEFKGADYGVIKSSNGDVWTENLPIVVSGHIHKFQVLTGVIYPGAPIQHNYGESSDRALMYIEHPDKPLAYKRIKMFSVPEKRVLQIEAENMLLLSERKLMKMCDCKNGTILFKLVINAYPSELKALRKSRIYTCAQKICDKIEIKTKKTAYHNIDATKLHDKKLGIGLFVEKVKELLEEDTEAILLFEKMFTY
uniref:DNA repair exonuclease n=1 Tax=Pithovirus LCDPAC01 TaxID=2506600 RepID=A0A481YQP8_9VIRU|nr:MAG: DNA repair exonuclease [Pithovirus LCDPAC01]